MFKDNSSDTLSVTLLKFFLLTIVVLAPKCIVLHLLLFGGMISAALIIWICIFALFVK